MPKNKPKDKNPKKAKSLKKITLSLTKANQLKRRQYIPASLTRTKSFRR